MKDRTQSNRNSRLICRANQCIGFIWGKVTLINFLWVLTKWTNFEPSLFLQWRLSMRVWDWMWQIGDYIIVTYTIYDQYCYHIKTNQLIYTTKQLIGFHKIGMLASNRSTYLGLTKQGNLKFSLKKISKTEITWS